MFGVCTDLLNHFVFTVISRRLLLYILLWCALSTSYLLYYLGCTRMLYLATLSKVFQLYMDNLESGMSMDFLSMFASNVWNIIIHKSIVRYIVTVVKMYSLNLSQHSHNYDIIIRAKLLINIVIYKYGSYFLIGSDWSIASLPWAGGGYVLLERILKFMP
jgi:hypothetical protein